VNGAMLALNGVGMNACLCCYTLHLWEGKSFGIYCCCLCGVARQLRYFWCLMCKELLIVNRLIVYTQCKRVCWVGCETRGKSWCCTACIERFFIDNGASLSVLVPSPRKLHLLT